ncbi:MAG: PstS family phosphate ABC transporter substrate-binding protein [Methylobacterium sp.]|nr:PstS family phosphate ABC transporter substrate-binding protein [Methylobacterium sp.]MCA3655598.1 PstS family phosphate ABC transporter substrate-binding protein [Methylobacterium sp.]MCA3656719.1 PstS family phosphate ABC transporter substrate-binding protein [Methylobacterium sp.]MCA3660126.1 PstS family phosphate ABC transporter substrate-binding protein [Methylobacterium sp.]MCA3663264.1 PstS family phosphate ABC transporter substrate-binding protein [Methylobacterium sp.]
MTSFRSTALLALALLSSTGLAAARDQIRIVGSSTVYPFTTVVAEQLGKTAGVKTPVVESTGTGGGMKLFCDGVGVQFPDATNASRRMKAGEFELCQKNGVKDIMELMIGYDGLTLAFSKKNPPLSLTRAQVFLALAKNVPGPDGKLIPNPYKTWNQVDPSLPNRPIEVLGPPPTSGTRDSFHELVLEPGAEQIPAMKALKAADRKAFDAAWKSIREDGVYVEAGENDNVIVQKLEANPGAIGIFGYSFLEENVSKVQGVKLDGVEPNEETISTLKYPAAREMFVYVKKAHIGVVPGLDKFAQEFVSNRAAGDGGYLEKKGLVPVPKDRLANSQANVANLKVMTGEGLPK